MNEEEAQTKVCPIMVDNYGKNIKCIASNCMAWKWYDIKTGYCVKLLEKD